MDDRLDLPSYLEHTPEVRARIDILLEKHPGVVKAPLGGVFEDGGDARAYVKGAEVEERALKLGSRNDDQVEVLDGLKPGEVILLEKPDESTVTKKAVRSVPVKRA